MAAIALGVAVLKEVSGEAAIERVRVIAAECGCEESPPAEGRRNVYLIATARQFNGIRHCR